MKGNLLGPRRLLVLHLLATAFGLILGWGLTLRLRPESVGDLGTYWELASRPGLYAKGGALYLLLVPLRLAGLAPFVAAAVIDSVGWLALAWALWRPREHGPLAQVAASAALLCLAAWFAGLFGIVNTDLPCAGLVAAGLRLLFRTGDRRWRSVLGAMLVLGLGMSMRVQSMLGLGLSAGVFLVASFVARRPPPRRLLAVAGAGLILVAVIEAGLRTRTADPIAVAATRLPVYSGLLATSPGEHCGEWTASVSQAEEEDTALALTLAQAARKRLPGLDVGGIVACKLVHFAGYSEISGWYLAAGIDAEASPARAAFVEGLAAAERRAGLALKSMLVLLVLAALLPLRGRPWRDKAFALAMPISIVVGYLGLHAVVEILPRYVLGPVVFSLVCALQALAWARGEASTSQQGP